MGNRTKSDWDKHARAERAPATPLPAEQKNHSELKDLLHKIRLVLMANDGREWSTRVNDTDKYIEAIEALLDDMPAPAQPQSESGELETGPVTNSPESPHTHSVTEGNLTGTDEPQAPKLEPETFKHMITVLMIMFGDAREKEFEPSSLIVADDQTHTEMEREAFKYAESWFEEYQAEVDRREAAARVDETARYMVPGLSNPYAGGTKEAEAFKHGIKAVAEQAQARLASLREGGAKP